MSASIQATSSASPHSRTRAAVVVASAASTCIATVLLAGCQSPQSYREQADEVAYNIIEQVMQDQFGEAEPFTITPAERTLRRKLMLDQRLARSSEASLSSRDVPRIEQWPDPTYNTPSEDEDAQGADLHAGQHADQHIEPAGEANAQPIVLSLTDALRIAAANSRSYQSEKEQLYTQALALNLEADAFRRSWTGVVDTLVSTDLATGDASTGITADANLGLSQNFEGGEAFTALFAFDLVKMLTQGNRSAFGLSADFSLSIPLLRGSGKFVVTEPLTQAQRDVVYAAYSFERFKRSFSVSTASSYLSVLQSLDAVTNSADNYRRVIDATRRASRLAEAGQLPEIQVDQARQDELRARDRWITAQQSYERSLDNFKITLGLPTDASIQLDKQELNRLIALPRYARYTQPRDLEKELGSTSAVPVDQIKLVAPSREDAGPLELPEQQAVSIALNQRLDLRTAVGRVYDAQRGVAISADNLRADITLLGSASFGESRSLATAGLDDGELRPERGNYSALIGIDLPFERTAERNRYRTSLIAFESAVRGVQQTEDQVKLDVREGLRTLTRTRESVRIQAEAVRVAKRRVESTDLFLQAGRAQVRDVLEAQDALLDAQDALTDSLVGYRIAELELQRDLGVLEVNHQGLWSEYDPAANQQNANE